MSAYKRLKAKGKYFYEHDKVWAANNGEIPFGMIVHHIDGDKRNNDIQNLKLMSVKEHNRLHAGCFEKTKEGVWHKTCPVCGLTKEVNSQNWYLRKKDGSVATGPCRECFKEKMRLHKRRSTQIT